MPINRKDELIDIISRARDEDVWPDLSPERQETVRELEAELAIIEMREKTEKQEGSTRVKRAQWRGKNYERRVAKLIHGVVVGRSKAIKIEKPMTMAGVPTNLNTTQWIQINCQKPPDVVNEWLSVECKHPKNLPVWLEKLMSQAIGNAPNGLTPVAWVGDREARTNYVIMCEKDFCDLHI